MKTNLNKYLALVICSVLLAVSVSSCKKDNYYKDGGLAKANFNGSILQYLQSNPKFDTIAQIVKLAGMEDILSKEDITFFAPTDEVIRRTIGLVNSNIPYVSGGLNQSLFELNKDTIKTLDEIPQATWRKYLMRYVLKGKYLLKDFPQLDFDLRPQYPGGYYYGYNGDLDAIGVVYNSVINKNTSNNTTTTIRYAGYRQLCIASIVDPSNPSNFYNVSAPVATSDIQASNGVVHVLAVYDAAYTYYNGADKLMRASEILMDDFGLYPDFFQEVILNR
ncbi:hypothetical protein FO440_02365 [Mucilaginibacter corticis]|uniref:FAS1 domain-containing protein n=1 Tax=Mucilaginibacter corticis TaxID=2597670 RepID=A0A556MT48_9SPHI|nr:fasciclin domain-containing protein [Mucilaginibacter corticis]TSJ43055.1 hypothetical protein FO440_02365 [Mucilaginibacter corticis]